MKVSDAYPSKYLRAADLQGRTIILTIAKVVMETLGTDQKPVVYFNDARKGLVTNKTNAGAIATFAGEEMDSWTGKQIELFPTPVTFQGRTVDAIRVRAPDPVQANKTAPAATPAPNDSDPDDPIDL